MGQNQGTSSEGHGVSLEAPVPHGKFPRASVVDGQISEAEVHSLGGVVEVVVHGGKARVGEGLPRKTAFS